MGKTLKMWGHRGSSCCQKVLWSAAELGLSIDLTETGQTAVLAKGGRGGHGNKRFSTSVRQAPRFAEQGTSGESGMVELRLKLLADAGLIGLPNAGKSSLLSRLTRADPKVADYPFTTLEPVLGTIEADDRQVVLADIPGLIEGAADGAGLGHEFLAHVERCAMLVHVVELAPSDGEVYTGISYVNILVVSVPAVVSFTGYESTDKYPTPDEYE